MEGREAISGAGTAPPQPQPQQQQPPPQPQPSAVLPSSASPAAPHPGPFNAAPPPTEPVKLENATQSFGADATGPAPATTAASVPPPATVQPPAAPRGLLSPPGSTGSMMMGMMKKKRGRPRKYAPDGSLVMPLSLMPPMSVASPTGEFTLTSGESITMSMKRGRGRALGVSSFVKQYARPEYESPPPPPPPIPSELSPCSYGGGFMPHIINVAAGEDVTMKIISFSQQGPRAICILSATGVISNVTLRQPDSSGGTLTYEGRFELLSLSGSFMPNDIGGARSRSGGMSVSLASPDGRVVGGGVAGLLVAASPVQVVVGSFMPSHQAEFKSKKPKLDSASVNSPPASAPISSNLGEPYNGGQGQHNSTGILKPGITNTSIRESWASLHPISDARNSTDINISLPHA